MHYALRLVGLLFGLVATIAAGMMFAARWGHIPPGWIAYVSWRGTFDVYVTSPQGGIVRRMSKGTQAAPTLDWSPDGQRVLIRLADRVATAHVASDQEHALRQLADRLASIADAAWSPDGRWIAVAGWEDTASTNLLLNIYRLRPDGSGLERLTNNRTGSAAGNVGYSTLSWSPDGQWLAYWYWSERRPQDTGIYRMRADGTRILRLADGLYPAWSPDGQWVYFSGTEGDDDVYRVRPDGSERQVVLHDIALNWPPVWSPDGRWMALATVAPDNTWTVYRARRDGSDPAVIASGAGLQPPPSWSPDSRHLVLAMSDPTQPGNGPDLYLIPRDGGPSVRLTTYQGWDYVPSWSPPVEDRFRGPLLLLAGLALVVAEVYGKPVRSRQSVR